ncbi:MAG: VCBS repeat-containing protein [Myxococcota bacterium]
MVRTCAVPLILGFFSFGASLSLFGCGEQSVLVRLAAGEAGSVVCLSAFGDGARVFTQAYPRDGNRLPSGTLTLVAGSRVDESVRVTARSYDGGRTVASATGVEEFASGSADLVLEPRRCHPRSSRAPNLRRTTPFGTSDELPGPIATADIDGDGRDEIWGAGANGVRVYRIGAAPSAVALDPGTELLSVGDLDGDCIDDLVLGGAGGIAPSSDPTSVRPLGAAATRAAIGAVLGTGPSVIAVANGSALIVDPQTGIASPLTDDAQAVVAANLGGDAASDVIVSGGAGTRLIIGGGAPRELDGALPSAFATVTGPLALGDFNGDSFADLAGAADNAVFVAFNRGDGLFETRGPAIPMVGVVDLRSADLDGDCLDDLIVLGGGQAEVFAAEADGSFRSLLRTPAGAIAVGDVNGDQFRGLIVSTPQGLEVWTP